jgi:Tol biopolymer transport system component
VKKLALLGLFAVAAALLLSAAPGQGAFHGANGPIAFMSTATGDAEIWSMHADGSGLTQLTQNPGDDEYPRFSPDGTKIAFSRVQPGGRDIFVMNTDGTGATNLTSAPGDDFQPSWSPDGSRIAFVGIRGDPETANAQIWVMNADGSGQTEITNTSPPGQNFYPAFSPDGTRIAFAGARSGSPQALFVMGADGSNPTQITQSPVLAEFASWSPDGSALVFSNVQGGSSDIYRVAPDGTGLTNLTNSQGDDIDPSYSPDGTKIVFSSSRDGNPEIYVMNADGSAPERLTNQPSSIERYPDWGVASAAAALPPPKLGETVNVSVVSGTVLVKTRGSSVFSTLAQARQIKVGSQLDTKKGTVRVVSAVNRSGKTQSGDFGRGVFQVAQSKSAKAKGLTDLTLKGGNFNSCKASGKKASAAKKKTIRSLFSKAKGKFRTKGRYSAASVRGTTWLVTDRCDGTLTSVKSGTVSVFDFKRHKTVKVKAGKSYLARASR